MPRRTLADYQSDPVAPQPAPIALAGEWVAWDRSHREIIAHGSELDEVMKRARDAGRHDAVYEMARRPDRTYVFASGR